MGTLSGLKPVFRVLRPPTDSVRVTPTVPHKTVPIPADGVESISERLRRDQAVGCFEEGAVKCAALWHL